MTDKKSKILDAALELFANEGYNATSTSKIAAKAKVSEGLIFKHFGNKQGLLDAIVKDGEKRVLSVFGPVLFDTNPKSVIRSFIEIPFEIPESEYDFWKLQHKIKWENAYDAREKMKPILDKLTWAFEQLNYKQPDKEAFLLNQIIESFGVSKLRDGMDLDKSDIDFLIQKYKL